MSKKLELEWFLKYYRKFYSIPTWTKEKHDSYDKLIEFLDGLECIKISSSRDNSTTKVHVQNGFTIFKVPEHQLGKMIPYRGNWVLMYCFRRDKFKHFLRVFLVSEGVSKSESLSLKKEFNYNYIDSLE